MCGKLNISESCCTADAIQEQKLKWAEYKGEVEKKFDA
jgi:hypothetical protein